MMMPKSRRGAVITGATLVLVALAVYVIANPRAKEVTVFVTAAGPTERVLAINGRIRPRLQVDIRSPLSGALVELPFDVGDRVEQGRKIARVDDAPEAAAIAEAQAGVKIQEASFAQAQRDLARLTALGEFAAKQDLEKRRLVVEESKRELDRRRASLKQVSELRERRVLYAPFSGVILERPVDMGQAIGSDTVIYRLADLSDPQITAEVDEIYAAEIHPDMEALVSFPGKKESFHARVLHVEPRVDPATGARDVRLELPKGTTDAAAGATVTINFLIERRAKAISIPRQAIFDATIKPRVRVAAPDGMVYEREIAFIDWPADKVTVTSGLAEGERVLVNPAGAEPGEKVRVAN